MRVCRRTIFGTMCGAVFMWSHATTCGRITGRSWRQSFRRRLGRRRCLREMAAKTRQVLRAQEETGGASRQKETAPETPASQEQSESSNEAAAANIKADAGGMSASAPSGSGAAPKRDLLF